MIVSVIPLLFIPEGGIRYQTAAAGDEGSGDGAASARGTGGDLRIFVVFLIAMLLINSGINSLATFKAQYLNLEEGFAASARTISLVMNVESAALILIGFFLGFLGRRMGIPALLVMGTLSGIVSLLIYAMAPSLGYIYLASAFKGVSDGCIAASSYAYASILIPPEKRGRYFAAYNATFSLSWGTSATLVTGPLIDILLRSGKNAVFSYRMGVMSAFGIMFLGLCILLALLAQRKSAKGELSPP